MKPKKSVRHTESVKIESEVVDSVRALVKVTKQSISGFISLAIIEKIKKESKSDCFMLL